MIPDKSAGLWCMVYRGIALLRAILSSLAYYRQK